MKKLKILVITLLVTLININVYADSLPEITRDEPIKVYFFWADYCGACSSAIEGINSLGDKYDDYFELITYEVQTGNNNALYSQMVTHFDQSSSIPLFVIGSEYSALGFSDTDSLVEAALEAYQDEDYYDFVAETISNDGNIYQMYTLEEACEIKGITYYNETEEVNKSNAVALLVVFGVIIGSFAALVLLPKSK